VAFALEVLIVSYVDMTPYISWKRVAVSIICAVLLRQDSRGQSGLQTTKISKLIVNQNSPTKWSEYSVNPQVNVLPFQQTQFRVRGMCENGARRFSSSCDYINTFERTI